MTARLYGLVLSGGASQRMQRDKAALLYNGKPQLLRAIELLQPFCARTFVSVRADQTNDPLRAQLPQIVDRLTDRGPIAGIHAAQTVHPEAAWLVLACDLPLLNAAALAHLLVKRDTSRPATAYRSAYDNLPEPLCAIYEPHSAAALVGYLDKGGRCPRKFLLSIDTCLLEPLEPQALDNVNTTQEYQQATGKLSSVSHTSQHATMTDTTNKPAGAQRSIQVQYFAVLREQAGRGSENILTTAATPADFYDELRQKYSFRLQREQLKVAINSEFSEWHTPLQDGDSVVFIPPVSGG